MGFKLVDEGLGGVVGDGAEEGFEFGARLAKDFVSGVVHGKFGVDEGAKVTKGGAFAVVGVEDGLFFFEGVECYVVVGAPGVNELLAVVKFVEDERVRRGGVELLEN